MIKLDKKRKKKSGVTELVLKIRRIKPIAFLGFPVTRDDSGRIHYYRHIFKLKNYI